MKYAAFVLLCVIYLSAAAQPLFRKAPVQVWLQDSVQSDFFFAQERKEGFAVTPLSSSWAGIENKKSGKGFAGFLQAGATGTFQRGKLRAEGYIVGGTGAYPQYFREITNRQSTFPGAVFTKRDSSSMSWLSPGLFLHFQASQHISVAGGFDRNFIGSGYRSMLLSDNAPNSPFLRFSAGFKKISYAFLLNHYRNVVLDGADRFRSDKYGVAHILQVSPWKWIDIQVFESVLWQSKDSAYNRGFDIQYLNPAIFFRPVEHAIGSADNALLGLGINLHPASRVTLYGQVLLDEFLLSEVKNERGWWGNKVAFQAGVRCRPMQGLALLGEINTARPFTYSHANPNTNYGHNGQALAHPMGANFVEALFLAGYNRGKHSFSLLAAASKKGFDDSRNFGGDIFRSYRTRSMDYGNKTGQGVPVENRMVTLSYGYLLSRRYNLELSGLVTLRTGTEKNSFVGLGLRTPFFNQYTDYP